MVWIGRISALITPTRAVNGTIDDMSWVLAMFDLRGCRSREAALGGRAAYEIVDLMM